MRRRFFPVALSALLFALCDSAHAQQPKNFPRIGYLLGGDPTSESARFDGIRMTLHDLGYIEGQNLALVYRYTAGRPDRVPALAAELVRLKVDIILVAGSGPAVQAAKEATKTIPIVMTGAGLDPVKSGLIESLARPGGNITGITYLGEQLGGKRLELLKETFPKLARVVVLYGAGSPASIGELKEVLPVAARALGLTVRPWEVREAAGFEKIFAALNKERSDGLYASVGPLTTAHRKRITSLSINSRLPAISNSPEFVEAGGLMSYGPRADDALRRAATLMDKILKGVNPGDLPVEQPTKFELWINLKTAKQIGLTIPPNVLARADRVIK